MAQRLSAPRATIAANRLNFTFHSNRWLRTFPQGPGWRDTRNRWSIRRGKTTLLNLIARFYESNLRSSAFGRLDLRHIRLRDIYGVLAIVTQDPFLFSTRFGTILLRTP